MKQQICNNEKKKLLIVLLVLGVVAVILTYFATGYMQKHLRPSYEVRTLDALIRELDRVSCDTKVLYPTQDWSGGENTYKRFQIFMETKNRRNLSGYYIAEYVDAETIAFSVDAIISGKCNLNGGEGEAISYCEIDILQVNVEGETRICFEYLGVAYTITCTANVPFKAIDIAKDMIDSCQSA